VLGQAAGHAGDLLELVVGDDGLAGGDLRPRARAWPPWCASPSTSGPGDELVVEALAAQEQQVVGGAAEAEVRAVLLFRPEFETLGPSQQSL
jgi:hypothetical protein